MKLSWDIFGQTVISNDSLVTWRFEWLFEKDRSCILILSALNERVKQFFNFKSAFYLIKDV